MMKKIHFLILCIPILAGSCNQDKNKADAYGNFEAVDLLVSSETAGRILELNVEEGSILALGEHVCTIDTLQASLKIDQLEAGLQTVNANISALEAQVNSSRVQRKNLLREYDRMKSLFNDGAATRKQMDDIEGQLQLVESQIKALETQVLAVRSEKSSLMVQMEQVRDQIRRAMITNPVEGTVLQKYKEQGEVVAPGTILYKIANLESLILRAYISGSQLSGVKLGDQVRVFIDSNEDLTEFPGEITWISSQSEFTPKIIQTREERVNQVYAVKIKVVNDGSLKIGMPGEVLFD